MSRSTQYVGHTNEVFQFLIKCERLEKVGESLGMFEEHVCDLYQFKDEDGNIWEEFVQIEPWSSGPMIFLAIRCEQPWKINAHIRKIGKRKAILSGWGWTEDPSMGHGMEFDAEKGTFYI